MRRAVLLALVLSSVRARAEGPALPASAAVAGVACTFQTSQTRDYLIPLRLEAGALPFAWLLPHATISATVPVTKSPSELSTASQSDGVRIEGVAKLADIELHPATPTLLEGFLVLLPEARLVLRSAEVDRLEVFYPVPNDEGTPLVRPSRTPGAVIPCGGVDLAESRYEVITQGVNGTWSAGRRTVPLSVAPAGATVATIRFDQASPVAILEQRAQIARIFLARTTDAVVGWVPRWAVSPASPLMGPIGTLGHGSGMGAGQGFNTGTIRCPRAAPLIVEQGKSRRAVGVVDAGTTMEVQGRRDADIEVLLRTSAFLGAEDVHFLMEGPSLRDCRVREPPRSFSREHHQQGWPRGASAIACGK